MKIWGKTIVGFLSIVFTLSIIFSYISIECVLTQRSGIRKVIYTDLCHPRWVTSRQDYVRNYLNENLVGKKDEYANEVLSKFGFYKSYEYLVNDKRQISYHLREGRIGSYNTEWTVNLIIDDMGAVRMVEVGET